VELFFKFQGSEYKNLDHGLILMRYRGLSAKWRGFLDSYLFLNWEGAWTESMAHGPWQRWSMVDRG
jgi:hypothetical protein